MRCPSVGLQLLTQASHGVILPRRNDEMPERGIATSPLIVLLPGACRRNDEMPERGIATAQKAARTTRQRSRNDEMPERGIATFISHARRW